MGTQAAGVVLRLMEMGLQVDSVPLWSSPSWLARVLLRAKPKRIGFDHFVGGQLIGQTRVVGNSKGGCITTDWHELVPLVLQGATQRVNA